MTPTADAFRALARSSPWRWSRLHWRHRSERWSDVEAWVVRPGWQLVRIDGAHDQVDLGVPSSSGSVTVFVPDDGSSPALAPPRRLDPLAPQDVVPAYRADGLVAVRPDASEIHYEDPLFASTGFDWVAMLDPVELSHHVDVTDLHAQARLGRETWSAYLVPRIGYEPRCGGNCCDLLWSEAGLRSDFPDQEPPPIRPGTVYPNGFWVSLDVQTGIVVSLAPDGGNLDHLGFSNRILAVDDDVVVPDGHVPRPVRGSAG